MLAKRKTVAKLDELLGRLDKLPPLPKSIQRINQMIDRRETTLDAVGQEIASDPALAIQVLQMVNSSFYGYAKEVSSVKHAVVLLGLNVIRTLVSSSWITSLVKGFSLGFHHHSLATARASFVISRSLGVGEPEQISTLGLLHDLGKVIMCRYLPLEFAAVTELAGRKHICFHEAEQRILGLTHAAIGAGLLVKWNLPDRTIIPIEYHHRDELPKTYEDETAVLMLANLIVRAEGLGYTGDEAMPQFHNIIAEQLDLKVDDLKMLSDEVCDCNRDIPRYIGAKMV